MLWDFEDEEVQHGGAAGSCETGYVDMGGLYILFFLDFDKYIGHGTGINKFICAERFAGMTF